MTCKKCGKELQDGASFCTECGAKVENLQQNSETGTATQPVYAASEKNEINDTITCPHCGKQIVKDAAVCPYCARKMKKKKRGKKKFVIIALLVLMACILFRNVGNTQGEMQVVGKWEPYAIGSGATSITIENDAVREGVKNIGIEFDRNHKGEFEFNGQILPFTWEYTGRVKSDDGYRDYYNLQFGSGLSNESFQILISHIDGLGDVNGMIQMSIGETMLVFNK